MPSCLVIVQGYRSVFAATFLIRLVWLALGLIL